MTNETKIKPVHTERIFITSEMARRFLRNNTEGNRRIATGRVTQYARDMKAGNWAENAETIKFADTGELIDGQHRLTACVEAGVGFWALVAYGVTKGAFLTIDRNQPRTVGQQLGLTRGITDYNNVSAALRWLFSFRDGIVMMDARPTITETAQLLTDNPGIPDSVSAARNVQKQLRTPSVSAMAFCHYAMSRQDATLAEAFFEALATGASLRQIDPVFRLRERIISSSASLNKRIAPYEFIALVFKAWIAEREGRTIEASLRWQVGESFPNIGPIGTKKVRVEGIMPPPVNLPKKKLGAAGKRHGKNYRYPATTA